MAETTAAIAEMGITRILDEDFSAILDRLPPALKAEGFGVLTEIDVKHTLKEKIGVEFRRYKILGACNPPAAHKVLSAAPQIGLLLPCNVIAYELDDGRTCVSAFDPMQMLPRGGFPESLEAVATDIRARLERVVHSL